MVTTGWHPHQIVVRGHEVYCQPGGAIGHRRMEFSREAGPEALVGAWTEGEMEVLPLQGLEIGVTAVSVSGNIRLGGASAIRPAP